jgi:hypothetical protein
MAERRMFAKTIIDSDAFIDMPLSTQALYFHLSMRADDDGFINNPKKIMRMIGASEDDLKVLCLKKFIIPFESGIVVIKHWKIHNYIQKDRYKQTVYSEERSRLSLKENGAYTECIQDVSNMETQVRLGQSIDSIGKGSGSIGESEDKDSDNNDVDNVDNSFEYMGGTLGKGVVMLTKAQWDSLLEELGFDAFNHYVEKLANFIIEKDAKVANHYATIRKWAKEDAKV